MTEGMEAFERVFQAVPAGLALDVASGPGGFAEALMSNSKRLRVVVAADSSLKPLQTINTRGVIPAAMDAGCLAFRTGTFSAAAISNSLHHMEDPAAVLAEMLRVLAPGGMLIVREMFSGGGQTPAQITHTLMHNWWGRVDTSRGILHRRVFTSYELRELVENSGARDIRFSEVEDITGDPFDEAVLKRIEQAYDAYMGRTSDPGLKEEGTEALTHMREHGFAGGRALLACGWKPV